MTLAAAISNLQAKARAISGIKEAPDSPPENAGQFPFAVTYPRNGQVDDPGWRKGLHTIFTEFHTSRVLLGSAITATMGYMDAFEDAIARDPRLGGTVDTIVFPIRYTFGRMEWNGIPTIGVRYEITVKIQTALSA